MSVCLNPDCIQECGTLRRQVRDLQRTVAFFASVIKSGESWSEDCEKAWPVTLEPCVHDFHRAEHGVMPCTKCGAEAHADAIRALAPATKHHVCGGCGQVVQGECPCQLCDGDGGSFDGGACPQCGSMP